MISVAVLVKGKRGKRGKMVQKGETKVVQKGETKRGKYNLKARAERYQQTRQRIVETAVELHRIFGPAQTTITDIAKKAGVQRRTVYNHFPDELSLFKACSAHHRALNPPPDPEPWKLIPDPEERLRRALAEVYAYYRRNEQMQANVTRDAQANPNTRKVLEDRKSVV